MKTKQLLPAILLVILVGLFYSSCKKSDRESQNDITTAIDNAEAQNAYDGIWKQIIALIDSTSFLRSSCADISYSTTNPFVWPKTVTIDYGVVNCVGADGNNRRGQIAATFTKKYSDSLAVITLHLNNYIHNDQLVEGTIFITNKGRNAAGNYNYNYKVHNGIITTSIGKIFWAADQNREWIIGKSTINYSLDDIYNVTGASSGISQNGNSFTTVINTPLYIEPSCAFTSMGALTVYPNNYSKITVDFGNGTCDNVATAIINKKATEILLL